MTRSGGAGRAKPPAARAKPPKAKTKTNEGRWTDDEHRKFLEAYDAMVAVDPARRRWPNVAAAVGVKINQCVEEAIALMARSRRAVCSCCIVASYRMVPHRSTEPARPRHRREMT